MTMKNAQRYITVMNQHLVRMEQFHNNRFGQTKLMLQQPQQKQAIHSRGFLYP